jgi:hypothetical protein
LLAGFEFEKQMIMKYTNTELLDMVERYKAESKIPIGNDVKLGFALFARWLLSQNLQQTPCTTLRGKIEPLMNGDKLFMDANLEESSNLYYTGKFIAYENVLKLIDELQPVPVA